MPFDFISPGAAAGDAIRKMMVQQEALRRQQMLDNVTVQREQRLGANADANAELAREQLASVKEQRAAAIAQREQDTADKKRAADLAPLMRGDADPGGLAAKYPAYFQPGTMASRTLDMSTAAPALPTRDPQADGPDVTGDVAVPDAMPTAATMPTPRSAVPMLAGQTREATDAAYRGTTAERKTAQEREALTQILQSDPAAMADPAVQTALKVAQATGETTGLYAAIAALSKPPTPTAPHSLAQQANEAHARGDMAEYKRLLKVIGDTGKADDRTPQPIYISGLGLVDGTGKVVNSFGSLPETTPEGWGDVIARVTNGMPASRRYQKLGTYADLLERDKLGELADQIRQTAIEGENVDLKNQIMNRQNMKASLKDVQAVLTDLQKANVPMNILTGTVEDVTRKLGATTDPRYVALGNRLKNTLINYRRAATGVAFSEKEQADYEAMFPNYRSLPSVNTALIDGMLGSMDVLDNAYWTHKLGPDGAKLVMGAGREKGTGGNSGNSGNSGGGGGVAPPGAGRVTVKSKDGTVGTVPVAQLPQALANGYTQVQ